MQQAPERHLPPVTLLWFNQRDSRSAKSQERGHLTQIPLHYFFFWSSANINTKKKLIFTHYITWANYMKEHLVAEVSEMGQDKIKPWRKNSCYSKRGNTRATKKPLKIISSEELILEITKNKNTIIWKATFTIRAITQVILRYQGTITLHPIHQSFCQHKSSHTLTGLETTSFNGFLLYYFQ